MHEPLYRQAIAQSWRLAWKHKGLWPLGLLAGLLGQLGLVELLTAVGVTGSGRNYLPFLQEISKNLSSTSVRHDLLTLPAEGMAWLAWLVVILIGLAAVGVFAAVVAQGAIIYTSAASADKKELFDTTKAWDVGIRHFWRMLSINLLKKICFMLLGSAVAVASANAMFQIGSGGVLIFFCIFLLALLVGICLSLVAVYAGGYVVVEEYSLGASLRAAWKLFTSHWLVSLEVGTILLVANIVASVMAVVLMLLSFIPAVVLLVMSLVTLNGTLFLIGMFLGIFLSAAAILSIGAVFTVFSTSVWTYLFMKMHRHGVVSRLVHVFHR